MPVRPATPSDEPAMASVLASAFWDDSLWALIIPHRNEYPEDVNFYWSETLRKSWSKPNERLLVSTVNVDGIDKVAGVAVWQRQGDDAGKQKVESEWVDVGSDAFRPLPDTPNRAVDPSKVNILDESYHYGAHFWSGDRRNNWYLILCGIHRDYAGKGLGRELVLWGLERAREENVHASVVASQDTASFYLRCGFDEIVGNCNEGEGNPLNDTGGGDALFMYPKK
ncbi:acetyltransferase [Pyrenophora teres f. maculata]|nr:acetyltransferase [Pyrenophora teres f. maculata]